MAKLYYRKIETCSNCPFHYINNLEGYSSRCVLAAKDMENKNIPEWCPLTNYEEKIEVNETGNVWVKINTKNG